MKDIDIINNNDENFKEVKPPRMDSIKNPDILIDVSQIAFQLSPNQLAD